jgi:hypothetical protein
MIPTLVHNSNNPVPALTSHDHGLSSGVRCGPSLTSVLTFQLPDSRSFQNLTVKTNDGCCNEQKRNIDAHVVRTHASEEIRLLKCLEFKSNALDHSARAPFPDSEKSARSGRIDRFDKKIVVR